MEEAQELGGGKSKKFDDLCRLCAAYDFVKMDLFGQESKNRKLVKKIEECLFFPISENDRLPHSLCYKCMYNLESFYNFRVACLAARGKLEKILLENNQKLEIKQEGEDGEQYSELRMELLKEQKEKMMMPEEAPIVNPNAALGTPPPLRSPDGEIQDASDDQMDDPDMYQMELEMNPSDFLEITNTTADESTNMDYPQSNEVFQRHSEQHEVYVCSMCNKAFSSKGHLSLHARIHVGAGDVIGEKVITNDHTSYSRPYKCDLCNKSYSTAKHRWGHVSTSHRGHPAVTCRYCSRIYSTRKNLAEHVQSRHDGLPPPPEAPQFVQDTRFQCKTCPKMYTNVTDLNKHTRVCLKEQQRHNNFSKLKSALENSDISSVDSDYEHKDYRSAEAKLAKNPQLTILKQALTKGEKGVKKEYEKMLNKAKKQSNKGGSGGKKWYCEVCPQNFGSENELRQHEKSHDADKPYICCLCNKDFVVKSSLSRHILSFHGVDPTPMIDSDKCLKKSRNDANSISIKQEENLTKETSVSPYSCENMENDDEEPENGNENMLELETVFVCEICTRDFNDRASLWLHIRATHKEFAAFACGICLKICEDNAQLKSHFNMYHEGSKLLMSEQRRYSCTICGRQHDSRKKLMTHVKIHNLDPNYDPSNFVQLNANYYNESVNSNDGNELIMDIEEDSEKIDCYICNKTFPSEDHLVRHQRNAHKSEQASDVGSNGRSTPQNGNNSRAQYHLFYVCELCGTSHPNKWERWLHVSSMHSNEPSITCERDDCAKIFATKNLKNEHAQHHLMQGVSPNTCEICGKLWGSRVDYWKHVMGVHSDTVPLICGVCLKVFPDVIQLSQHVKLKHWPLTNGDFSCDICGRPYSNKSKMSRHRKIHGLDGEALNSAVVNENLVINDVSINDLPSLPQMPIHLENGFSTPTEPIDVPLVCEQCNGLKFETYEEFCNHRRSAHALYPCDLCNKCYGRTSHLWKHVNRVHKGHADVTCRYCNKTSASKDHLAAHIIKIHKYEPEVKNEIPDMTMNYKTNYSMAEANSEEEGGIHFCEKCNKPFNKRYLLRRHMKGCQNYRKDPGALLTRCRACERIFKDRASLQKHIENHHSSYECHLCKETVTSKLGIMTHNRLHHMHHPDLTCEIENCRKLFRTKEDLESHRKEHKHHGSPNVCDYCGDSVENKLKLKMHILSLHRNEIGVSCGVCLIPMKDPKDLKSHVEELHNGVLNNPNTCQVCGKQYASKWKAFDHTKKCHGKVFKTCKQCLAVFTSEELLRTHYTQVHNVPKDQLDAYLFRLEVSGKKMEATGYNMGSLEVVVKEEQEELDFDLDAFDDDNASNDSKRRRSPTDTFDCEICPEIFLNNELLTSHYRNVHNTEPLHAYKKVKVETQNKSTKKMRERENYECGNCQKVFCTKTLYLGHVDDCTVRKSSGSAPTSILEAHLKSGSRPQKEEPESLCDANSLNIPDFNLFEEINMQVSGQKPVPSLMPLANPSGKSSKYSRKDSRKVYDETTNTECTCEVCGKPWPAKKHLWQHLIRFHRSEAAVTCGVCLKHCITYEGLAEHLKTDHPTIMSSTGNNFTCKVCGRYHNARSKLLLHMSIHINYNEDRADEQVAAVNNVEEESPMVEELDIKNEIVEKGEDAEEANDNTESSDDSDSSSGSSSDSSSSDDDDSDDDSSKDSDDQEISPKVESITNDDDSSDENTGDVQVDQKPDLDNFNYDERSPAMSPILPTAIKADPDEEENAEDMGDSEDEDQMPNQMSRDADPNAEYQTDNNSMSSNEGEEEIKEEEQEEQEVDEEQEEEEQEIEQEYQEQEQEVEQEYQEPEHEVEQEYQEQELEEEEEVDNVVHEMNEEVLEVDENDLQNLNGTVLMITNDEDGNQIVIERNMADLENDDSVHDMARYVFEDGTSFALEDYEGIVEGGNGDEEEEDCHGFEMDIGNPQVDQQVEELEEVMEQVEQEEDVEDEEELTSSAKS